METRHARVRVGKYVGKVAFYSYHRFLSSKYLFCNKALTGESSASIVNDYLLLCLT